MFSSAYINKLLSLSVVGGDWEQFSLRLHHVRCFFDGWNTADFLNPVLKNFRQYTKSPPHQKLFQLTSIMLRSVFWISWPLKIWLIGCPTMSVRNYHSMLCSIPQDCRFHMAIWQCRHWFDCVWSGSKCFGLSLYTQIWAKFKQKPCPVLKWIQCVVVVNKLPLERLSMWLSFWHVLKFVNVKQNYMTTFTATCDGSCWSK
jgi:hypothetical protein